MSSRSQVESRAALLTITHGIPSLTPLLAAWRGPLTERKSSFPQHEAARQASGEWVFQEASRSVWRRVVTTLFILRFLSGEIASPTHKCREAHLSIELKCRLQRVNVF